MSDIIVPPHGGGKAANPDAPRIEQGPVDEQPWPEAGAAAPLVEGRDPETKRIRSRELAVAMSKMPRRRKMLPAKIACHPKYEKHNANRTELDRRRRGELCEMAGGHIGAGVCADVNAAAWLYSGAALAFEIAAETGDLEMFKTGGALAMQAKQLDWSAYGKALREAAARPKSDPLERLRRELVYRPPPDAPPEEGT